MVVETLASEAEEAKEDLVVSNFCGICSRFRCYLHHESRQHQERGGIVANDAM